MALFFPPSDLHSFRVISTKKITATVSSISNLFTVAFLLAFQPQDCLAFIIKDVRYKKNKKHSLSTANNNNVEELSLTFPSIDTDQRVADRDIIDHVYMIDKSLRDVTGNGVTERMGVKTYDDESKSKLIEREYIYKNICLNDRWVLISHGIEDDPIYNFVNIAGLQAFHRTWDEVRKTPSRESVVLQSKDEGLRIILMEKVTKNGFVEGASGIRVRGDGQFVRLVDAVVRNHHVHDFIF